MKILPIFGLLLVVIFIMGVFNYVVQEEDSVREVERMEYQGPVPEGYDVDHYRKTGETILEVEE